MNLITLIYNGIFIPLGLIILKVLSIFIPKIKEREEEWENSLSSLDNLDNRKGPRLWVHSASMGEFEQVKPVIEKIKETNPNIIVICSFYSPSGYNTQKKYSYADAIIYLPFDTRSRVKRVIEKINPNTVIFVRYDIWRNVLQELSFRKIPIYLICATKPKNILIDILFFLKAFTKSNYNFFNEIYTVGESHTEYFKNLNIKAGITTLSDTRFDRIIQNVEIAGQNPVLPPYIFQNEFILVIGSSWQPDEDIIFDAVRRIESSSHFTIRMIIVPHEPTVEHLKRVGNILDNCITLSMILKLLSENNSSEKIMQITNNKNILVDSIGKLLRLYVHADAAYIGGGFGAGVHSVTEPAGYGIPLATGPKIESSPDAIKLKEIGALTVVKDTNDLYNWLYEVLIDKDKRFSMGTISKKYVYDSKGSSAIIALKILESLS